MEMFKNEQEINEFVEEFKTHFSGSSDYMSGVNDGAYSMLRKIKSTTVNANEPLPECIHNQYCDKQTTDLHCMSKTGCNFKVK